MSRKVDVIGAIHGNCVYAKMGVDEGEARLFIECIGEWGGGHPLVFRWQDGDMFTATPELSAVFWFRATHE